MLYLLQQEYFGGSQETEKKTLSSLMRFSDTSNQGHISIDDEIEKAKASLEKASKEEDFDKASEHCKNAKIIIKNMEKIAISKETPRAKRILGAIGINRKPDHSCHEGIANAYHRLGIQLDILGKHKKARKSYAKAEKWGYVAAKDPVEVANSATSKSPVLKVPKIVKDIAHVQLEVFKQVIAPPVAKHDLPESGGQITSTLQLAYCLALMKQPSESLDELSEVEIKWLQAMAKDEQDRLQAMATDLIQAFVRDELKKSDVVAEVVCLSSVLDQDNFRKLLHALVDGIDQSVLLQVHLLDGLSQLLRNATPGCIDADDLVKILEILSERLKGTHSQSVQNTYRLALAVSRVLDSMVDSQVERLKREQLHEPLSNYMKELQENSDPFLVYQAAYAYQAIQYIPDDESILQAMLRRTGKVIQGISGLVSAVKALDIMGFIDGLYKIQNGLQNFHKGLEDAGKVVEYIQGSYQSASEVLEGGKIFLECLKEGLSFSRKSSWYPALRGLDTLLQEIRIGDFEKLIRKAPCREEPAFQWGVCQRLGELASRKLWDTQTRQCAVVFLGRLYNKKWNQENVKLWILYILHYLGTSSDGVIGKYARDLRKILDPDDRLVKTPQFRTWSRENICPYSSMATLALQTSPLLDCVLNKPDVDSTLNQLKRERLKERGNDIYIPPRAKASLQGTEEFDLTSKVQEFLDSEGKVFLLLGDSGAGKSTFNRALEISLWEKYEKDGRIPLFIHLPTIDNPEQDLIAKRLRMVNFTAKQIQELKANRKVILICDGYDESQTTQNFYKSNNLNEPGGWRAQMIISCRTDYVGINYKDHFQPTDRNTGGDSKLFQESVIAPFSSAQIQHYISQYVTSKKPLWGSEAYKEAINQIPNLKDMVKNPFLLKLALEVLPEIDGIRKGYSEVRITRIELYDRFVMQWLERSRIRFTDMKLQGRDGKAFRWLLENGFQEQGISYLKELAVEIYSEQGGNPVVSYLDKRDLKSWKGRISARKKEGISYKMRSH
ncbi:hypothetical protein BGX26_011507 [Mortierella sp. AD094]|nr:hypothetical protein BGX26_011507 [Mortierella sp. AD094]